MQYAILPKMVEVLFKYCENVKFNFVDKEDKYLLFLS